jgi:hypothetical protein
MLESLRSLRKMCRLLSLLITAAQKEFSLQDANQLKCEIRSTKSETNNGRINTKCEKIQNDNPNSLFGHCPFLII